MERRLACFGVLHFPIACAGHIRTAQAMAQRVSEITSPIGMVLLDCQSLVIGELKTTSIEYHNRTDGMILIFLELITRTTALAQIVKEGADCHRILGKVSSALHHQLIHLKRVVYQPSAIFVVRATKRPRIVAFAHIFNHLLHSRAVDFLKYCYDSIHNSSAINKKIPLYKYTKIYSQ